ncbi:MAG TPA: PBP1A family penicillin-binding protein [Pyrinomonadaceae bacterium]|nr:PBP1A family penicillin-binding protein [Pyrinomonadaceae bacterium]
MPIRYPPDKSVPPVAKKKNGNRPRRPKIVKYEQPPEGFFRRWRRRILRPQVIIPLVFLTTVTIGVLGYYWYVFSKRIDQLLNGEIYTRSAGIYAAPKQLFVGENLSVDDLLAYLKRCQYVEKSQQADSARGRYAINGESVEVEPSADAMVDGQHTFPRLRIQFAHGGKGIAGLFDLGSNARYDRAQLEPELISSVTGQERAKRKVIGFKDIPKNLVNAIIATEDRSFFEHYGVNFRGIFRALLRRYSSDSNSPIAEQGGSGITQQLVKNLLLSPERTLRRKLSEAYMSIILETRLNKEQIFELYCNQIYLGQQAGFSINGVGEAASAYFGKDVTALTLPESAFIAGLIRSPNRYNPYKDNDTATARRNQVLDSMVETGAITEEQSTQAKAEPLKIAPTKGRVDAQDAPYFADYVESQLGDIITEQSAMQHRRIYTTIDIDLQRSAYAAVTKQLSNLDKLYAKKNIPPGTLQAALIAMNPHTGEIVAMVGGRDYTKSQLNHVTDARRQPGSVFKPFVYATALNTAYDPIPRVITPATIYKDEPKTFWVGDQQYSPGNFGDKYSNQPVTLRDALARSLNVVTVEVAQEVTIGRVMNLAAKAGLPKPPKPYLAMALGTNEATPLQIASAYTAFAANGTRTTPIAINRVTDGKGTTVTQLTGTKNEVLRPEVSYVLTSMLKDVVNRGTAAKLGSYGLKNVPGKIGIAGKTGTSRDGWFAGYTPNLVCVVWVGFDDNRDIQLTGADSALPIWADFMNAALSSHPEWAGDWQMPAGIETEEIDARTGQLASTDSPTKRTEIFLSGTAPSETHDAQSTDETVTEASGDKDNKEPTYEPAPLPEETPEANPRKPSKLEGRSVPQADGTARLQGTITLDIDPTTGLIADPTVCPIIRSKTFIIGTEPHKYCGPEYHQGRARNQIETRPRTVAPR